MVFICENCGKEFTPNYRISRAKIIRFCSKTCKSINQRVGYRNKNQLENAIIVEIKKQNRYLTIGDILMFLKVSSKTLSRFRISITSLNRKCGMKGRIKSVFEDKIFEALNTIYPSLIREMTFADCLSPKGYPLRFDFYIPEEGLLIEADGTQHDSSGKHPWTTTYMIECDKIKDRFAEQNNYVLLRIPYTVYCNIDYVTKYLSKTQIATAWLVKASANA